MDKPRILIINPNTATEITELIRLLAVHEVAGRTEIAAVTAAFGARYIASRVSALIAGHAVLDAYASALSHGPPPDAVVIACFGDPGFDALREIAGIPVLGFAESGLLAATEEPGKFAIATIGEAWKDMLSELVISMGLADRLAGFILLDEVTRRPDVAPGLISTMAKDLGAVRVIVGGTGLIPAIPQIAADTSLPVVDPHRATIRRAVERIAAGASAAPPGLAAGKGTFGGLSVNLTQLLEGAGLATPLAAGVAR